MRKALFALTVGVLATVLAAALSLLAPSPASALRCVHPREQLDSYALLVQAEVLSVEKEYGVPGPPNLPEHLRLRVSRYFKGEGTEELTAVYSGGDWVPMKPVGAEVIMAFDLDEETGGYRAGPCHLLMGAQPSNAFEAEVLALIHQRFGADEPPQGLETPAAPKGRWLLWSSLGALLLLTGAAGIRER